MSIPSRIIEHSWCKCGQNPTPKIESKGLFASVYTRGSWEVDDIFGQVSLGSLSTDAGIIYLGRFFQTPSKYILGGLLLSGK